MKLPIRPYEDPDPYPILSEIRMGYGVALPIVPIAILVPCLNCGETMKGWKIGALFCDDECLQAFRFKMEIGFQEPW